MSRMWMGVGPLDHELLDLDCPCKPTVHLCCDVCNSAEQFCELVDHEPREGPPVAGCWACNDGFGEQITYEQATALPDSVLILVRHTMPDDDDDDDELEEWQR